MKRLIHGDNATVMRALLADGSPRFDLIYLDPPYFTGRNHHLQGRHPAKGVVAFSDRWQKRTASRNSILAESAPLVTSLLTTLSNGKIPASLSVYLAEISTVILLSRELLQETGSLVLQVDPTASHYLKLICDLIFGYDCFRNEIIWHYRTGGAGRRELAKKHDVLLWYSRSETGYRFHPERIMTSRSELSLHRARNPKGARISAGDTSIYPIDVWEIPALNPMAKERTGYPTQKPELLLERLILAYTDEGDVIGDFYCGSGTTPVVAQRLGRSWLGVDSAESAVNIAAERLGVIPER